MGQPSVCGDLSGATQREEGWAEKDDVETLETAMHVPCAGFRHLFAFVATIVKVRVWVLVAPSLVASQTDR